MFNDDLSQYKQFYFPRLNDVCERLDKFYDILVIKKQFKPSTVFLGAIAALHEYNRKTNPDWMAQVAHSFREIFYELGLDRTVGIYSITYQSGVATQRVGQYITVIRHIAHHNFAEASKSSLMGGTRRKPVQITEEKFLQLVRDFGEVLFAVLRKQLDLHSEIDQSLLAAPIKSDSKYLRDLLTINHDAKEYFYTRANEEWLSWLWQNGFLDVVKAKPADTTSYSNRTPELRYISRIATVVPDEVVDILHNIPINTQTFNHEALDQFLRIIGELTISELLRKVEGRNLL